MTPPPVDPPMAVPYEQYMPPLRPKSVTVISIIGIIAGALGCLCIAGGTIWSFAMQGQQGQQMGSAMMIFSIVTAVAGLVLSIMLLVGSIGALSLKPWARSALIGFGAVDLIYDVAKLVLCIVWVLPMMEPMFRNNPQFQSNPKVNVEQMVKFAKISSVVTWGLIALVTIAIALAVLIVMNKPNVKAAFERRPEATM